MSSTRQSAALALAWAAALAIPTALAYAAYPARPGPDNDVPIFVGIALIIWWSLVSALAASELAMVRR